MCRSCWCFSLTERYWNALTVRGQFYIGPTTKFIETTRFPVQNTDDRPDKVASNLLFCQYVSRDVMYGRARLAWAGRIHIQSWSRQAEFYPPQVTKDRCSNPPTLTLQLPPRSLLGYRAGMFIIQNSKRPSAHYEPGGPLSAHQSNLRPMWRFTVFCRASPPSPSPVTCKSEGVFF